MTVFTDKLEPDTGIDTANGASATQQAYRALRRRIISGEIKPTQRLKVETLKRELNIGASPIREALSLLTSDQLVERIDQRGFRAAAADEAQFNDILRLRCRLEPMALRESIANGDTAWEESVVIAHHYLSRVERADTEAFENRHKQFHMALLAACDSPLLLKFCYQLYDLNIRYRYLAGRLAVYGKRDIGKEHQAIVAAALGRDADAACAELIQHYTRTGQFLAGFFGAAISG